MHPWKELLLLCTPGVYAMLHWSNQELVHHGWEGLQLNETSLLQVMLREDLQHIPIELDVLSAVRFVDGSLDKLLVLFNTSLVDNGMGIQGGSLSSNMLPGELQPFVKGDDSSGLEIHGIKHLLPRSILVGVSLVQF